MPLFPSKRGAIWKLGHSLERLVVLLYGVFHDIGETFQYKQCVVYVIRHLLTNSSARRLCHFLMAVFMNALPSSKQIHERPPPLPNKIINNQATWYRIRISCDDRHRANLSRRGAVTGETQPPNFKGSDIRHRKSLFRTKVSAITFFAQGSRLGTYWVVVRSVMECEIQWS